MSNPTARSVASSPPRPRLAAVKWSVPSTLPDTSQVDDWWCEERPRHSFIAFKGAPEVEQVAYDVWESSHALLVLVDLPGVEAEHLSLSLGSQALFLEVFVPADDESRHGVPAGHYEVRLDAPAGSGPDAIDASLSNGVLRIRVAKESAGTRRVAIVKNDSGA